MEDENYSEYSHHTSSYTMLTTVVALVIFIVLSLTLFFADTTNGIVGIVLYLLYISMMMLVFVTGESLATAFIYVKPKPKATTREKVNDAVFLSAILLWAVAVDFMFLIKDLAYHFAVSVTITFVVYGALVAYTFANMWKQR